MNLSLNRASIHENVFFGLLVIMIIGMQFSHFLVSLSMILMSANYLLEGKYIQKAKFVWKNYTILLFVGFFALHILGLWWSTDLDFGNHDVQIKLPLFALPMAIGSSSKLSAKKFEWVLLFFLATSLLSSIIGSVIYFVLSNPGDDYRLMSPYMSHIRLSLMMGVAVFSSFYLSKKSIQWQKFKTWFIALGFWFIIYLFMLRAMSGIVAVIGAGFTLLWIISSRQKLKFHKTIKLMLVGLALISVVYVSWQVSAFYKFEQIDKTQLEKRSPSGEWYVFDFKSTSVENGNYVNIYIAKEELKRTWNGISKYPFDGLDTRKQPLKHTLIRYLTSKGLRKDSIGVKSLTQEDIWAIENGIANHRYLNNKSINTLIYRYTWEMYQYQNGNNPQGNSLAQRFLFWKIGLEILQDNWLYGVGTGDVQLAFDQKYDNLSFTVQEKYQLRAHNQYLTFALTFGVFGFFYFIWMLFSGFSVKPNSNSFLFIGSFIILLISMLNEDTFETQFGITYALFFYFLFLFHQPLPTELKKLKNSEK
ncbi:MAG: O-antigen ligase family protein [Salibacteraceae bacterium]